MNELAVRQVIRHHGIVEVDFGLDGKVRMILCKCGNYVHADDFVRHLLEEAP